MGLLSRSVILAGAASAAMVFGAADAQAVFINNFFPSTPVAEGSAATLTIGVSASSGEILDGFGGTVTWGDSASSGASGFNIVVVGHAYADEGTYSVNFSGSGSEHDFNGFFGSRRNFTNAIGASGSITVLNVAPTFTAAPGNSTVDWTVNPTFNFTAAASDPGVNDVLTYTWDLDGDGQFDDFTGVSGTASYVTNGVLPLGVRVSDGDGGITTSSFNLTVVPEPGSLALLVAAPALTLLRRSRRR